MNVQDEFLRLKKAWMAAHGEEREQLDKQMEEFFASLDEQQQAEVRAAVDSDFQHIHRQMDEANELARRIDLRQQMQEILPFINVAAFSRHYFGRSSSWFYQRFNGNLVHGRKATFTDDELKIFTDALREVGSKISDAALLIN